jgi:hypothetical protein
MKNKIGDLRDHLFATIEDLRDPDNPMALDRAKTVAIVAREIIESAKVECQFIELTRSTGSSFFPAPDGASLAQGAPPAARLAARNGRRQ